MRAKGVSHKPTAVQMGIKGPVKVLNLAGNKKRIVLQEDYTSRIKTISHPNENGNFPAAFKTMTKDVSPSKQGNHSSQAQTITQPSFARTMDLKTAHARHVSTIERNRKRTIHDLMLDQELQSFREEVEWRSRNSTTNKTYKFPYTTLMPEHSVSESKPTETEPNCNLRCVIW